MKRKYLVSLLSTTLILFITIIFINFKVDVFGINSSQDYYYNDNKYERYQNIGLAKNYSYDTVITGTSLSENFKVSLMNDLYGVKSIKIPISGGTAKEQAILLKSIMTHGVKRVFLDVHYNTYSGNSDKMHPSFEFPEYLYDNDDLNDFKFYASFDTSMLSIKKLLFRDKYFTNDLDKLYNWFEKEKFAKNKVKEYTKKLDTSFTDDYNFQLLKNNFDKNILPVIKENSSVEFNFFFTPYNFYYFIPFYKENKIEDLIRFKNYFISNCMKYPNVNLHDFSVDYEVIENIDNYKDTHHFSQKISDQILLKMKENTFRIEKGYESKNINDYKNYIINNIKKLEK